VCTLCEMLRARLEVFDELRTHDTSFASMCRVTDYVRN
jgi:hypothetical protein